MPAGQFLDYHGPVAVDGVEFPTGRLSEHREGNLRAWEGSAWVAASRTPEGFSPSLAGDPVPVELPDGRRGMALVSNVRFDGAYWRLDLTGTGPAPGAEA